MGYYNRNHWEEQDGEGLDPLSLYEAEVAAIVEEAEEAEGTEDYDEVSYMEDLLNIEEKWTDGFFERESERIREAIAEDYGLDC